MVDKPTDTRWYNLDVQETAQKLNTDVAKGLTATEAKSRLNQHGRNELKAKAKDPAWKLILKQYADYMQLMLLAAAGLSVVIGDYSTAFLLVMLTFLNAFLGYRQEAKAEESVAALQQMMEVQARVMRDGQLTQIPMQELVPGDLVMFEAGDQVPADGRLTKTTALEIEESALTGESQPVAKGTHAIEGADVPLGDRINTAYMNSLVTRGTGEMIVTGTGMNTEIGHIATMLDAVQVEKSPLQKQIDQLTTQLGFLGVAVIVIVVGAGLVRGQEINELFFLATSIAVAAIPTGLPTVVTALLSLGTQQLAKANAIIKNLPSVETLGSTSAICSDKTGTLTLNKMTAVQLFFGRNQYKVSGVGYSELGQIQSVGGINQVPLEPVLMPMALCSDATVKDEKLVGDPTEGAVVVLAAKGGLDVTGTRQAYPRVAAVPFDSDYKFMATFHNMVDVHGAEVVRCYVKGAPDVIRDRAHRAIIEPGKYIAMSEIADRYDEANEGMAKEGLRVLGLAFRDFDPKTFDANNVNVDSITDMTVLGLVGIVDPPRPEARDAIAIAKDAGIRVRMITGDHKVTAGAIGRQLGIEGEAISGSDLQAMSDEELTRRIDNIGVIGRVAPEHKVRIVETLQKKGQVTAMTGDGVNDAPALKTSDIGIAMGITGTEVSKQAATMILTDDNFATIVHAIELGRSIYDNLLKYLRFQLITLMGYLVLFIGASIFNIASGAPLNPMQILWLNFAIDVPLALALGQDKITLGLMKRQPRDSNEPIMDRNRAIRWGISGAIAAILTLVAAKLIMPEPEILDNALATFNTVVLVTAALTHIFIAIGSRSETESIFSPMGNDFSMDFVRNLGIAFVMIVLVSELGFLQRVFGTASLTLRDWLIAGIVGAGVLLAIEVQKWMLRRQTH